MGETWADTARPGETIGNNCLFPPFVAHWAGLAGLATTGGRGRTDNRGAERGRGAISGWSTKGQLINYSKGTADRAASDGHPDEKRSFMVVNVHTNEDSITSKQKHRQKRNTHRLRPPPSARATPSNYSTLLQGARSPPWHLLPFSSFTLLSPRAHRLRLADETGGNNGDRTVPQDGACRFGCSAIHPSIHPSIHLPIHLPIHFPSLA